MNINATLFAQAIVFFLFIYITMKYIWPLLLKSMDERRERIAAGLAATDRAERELEAAKATAEEQINAARRKAADIVEQANQRHGQILEQAKADASAEKSRQVAAAQADIAQATNQARDALRVQLAGLTVLGAERLLQKEIDADAHRKLLDELIAEL